MQLVGDLLSRGKSVVIDNTHGEKETRKKFLDVIRQTPGVKCRLDRQMGLGCVSCYL